MNKFILMLLASIGLALICGCDGSTSQVKNGILGQHPDVTVGAAFDSSFDNAKWSTITDKGRKIVRFTGKIKQSTHDAAARAALPDGSTVHNNFLVSAIVHQFSAAEFERKFAPYNDAHVETKIRQFEAANAKEDEDVMKKKREVLELKLLHESEAAEKKITDELVAEFMKTSFWPVGQDVEFNFIVYPDGKQFEIDSFSNESWAKLKLSLDSVLNVIFAK